MAAMTDRDWGRSILYGMPNQERYHHESPEEYLDEALEDLCPESPCSVERMVEHLREEEHAIEVAGMRRAEIPWSWAESLANEAAYRVVEALQEEGVVDPDAPIRCLPITEDLQRAYVAATHRILREHGTWALEQEVVHLYETEELVALVREWWS